MATDEATFTASSPSTASGRLPNLPAPDAEEPINSRRAGASSAAPVWLSGIHPVCPQNFHSSRADLW